MRIKTGKRMLSHLRIITLFIVFAVLLSSSAVFATNTLYIPGQSDAELTIARDRNGSPHYVGFIDGYLNNAQNTFQLVCIDYNTSLIIPYPGQAASSYNVNVSTFNSLTDVKFRDAFGNPLLNQYKQAAWLLYQMEANPADTSAIQFAMWRIFKGETVPYTQASLAWYNNATDGNHQLTNDQLSLVRIFTPTNGSQETMSLVPLPAGVWLFGSGIAALVAIRRRKALKDRKGE